MELLEIVELVIALLFIASLVAIAVQRLRMPYTVGLVLVGLGLAFTRFEFFPEFLYRHSLHMCHPAKILCYIRF